MNNYFVKLFFRAHHYFSIILVGLFFLASIASLSVCIKGQGMNMALCDSVTVTSAMQGNSSCPMSMAKHIEWWKSFFEMSLSNQVGVSLQSGLFLLSFFLLIFYNNHNLSNYFWYRRKRLRALRSYLSELFSNGILHAKIYPAF